MADAALDHGSCKSLAADSGVEILVPVSECAYVVTILAPACDDTVWIRLFGAVARVRSVVPRTALIDVAGVTLRRFRFRTLSYSCARRRPPRLNSPAPRSTGSPIRLDPDRRRQN